MSIRVILVDDHVVIRQGVRALLALEPWLAVVGECSDGGSAIQMAQDLSPDVVVMDVKMSDVSGVEATRQILQTHPEAKVIALSALANTRAANEMIQAGATGYVLKDTVFEDLVPAIRMVVNGSTYISPRVQSVAV